MIKIELVAIDNSGTKAVLRIETESGPYHATVATELGAKNLFEYLGIPWFPTT